MGGPRRAGINKKAVAADSIVTVGGATKLNITLLAHFFRGSLTTSACIPARSNDIRQFLLVDTVEVDMLIKQAVAIFAAYGTFNKARAKDTRFDETTCRLVALERIRFAISRHKRVKVAFGQ